MDNWRDSLPDDIKGEASLSTFEDVSALAKGFIESKKLQGNSIRIPGEDAGEEDVTAFNTKMLEKLPNFMMKPNFEDKEQSSEFFRSLGKPISADKYKIPAIDNPDGVVFNEAKQNAFREIADKYDLTNSQFKGMMAEFMGTDIAAFNETKEKSLANRAAIKQQWGEAAGDNMKIVELALDATKAPESVVASVKDGSADPSFVAWLYGVGKALGSEGNGLGDGFDDISKGKAMSPAEAQDAINEINNNKDHAYWQKAGYPGKKEAMDQMVKLQRYAKAA